MSKRDELGNDASAVKGLLGVLAAGLVTAFVKTIQESNKQHKIGELEWQIRDIDAKLSKENSKILFRDKDIIRQLEGQKARLKQERDDLGGKKRW